MEETYRFYPEESAGFSAENPSAPAEDKTCPGIQQFCPHYLRGVCDVKYRECVLLNSLTTAATILRLEREHLKQQPTTQNLEMVAQINTVLHETPAEYTLDTATIFRDKLKGRLVAAGFLALVVVVALIIYAMQ
jgi:hypothetical protein